MSKEAVVALLTDALAHAGVAGDALDGMADWVEVPRDRAMGDFAFPCFRLAKALRKAPPMIASELLVPLKDGLAAYPELADVVAAGPYLNFKLNKAAVAASLIPAVLDGSFLARRPDAGEKVMIEYSQPNTHKAFHVGHTRNVALGDALVRIFEWCGYEVVATNYIGDEGTHIAKCLWYYRHHYKGTVPETNLGEFLGTLYTHATELLDFKTLSKVPMPGVTLARVVSATPIEGKKGVKRVALETGVGACEVVCGGVAYAAGDLVAWAGEGARVAGRLIGTTEKHGVVSRGMILSEKELGLSEDKETIFTFPADAPLGEDVAEYFRVPGALADDVRVLDEMQTRNDGVAATLKLLEAKNPEIEALWLETKKWSMDEFHRIYDWLGARFDHYFFESEVGDRGKAICMDYFEKGVLVKSEGAIGADLSDAGLPFFLLIKSDGSGLYSTKDIALAREKFENWGVDRSIYVVDVGQSLHFQQVFKTLEKMGYERAKKCYHLAYGIVKLPEGKMSSRDGNVILFSQLRHDLDVKIKADFLEDKRGDWSDAEIDEAARRISIATIRYGMVNQDNGKDIIYHKEEWTEKSGNTGPYLMYAYVRTRAILRKAGEIDAAAADWSLLTHEYENRLLNHMTEFPDIVARAREDYRPQLICIYLFQLAKDFSRFFDNCNVLGAETEALRTARLLLVDAVGRILAQGLALLGIPTLERM